MTECWMTIGSIHTSAAEFSKRNTASQDKFSVGVGWRLPIDKAAVVAKARSAANEWIME